MLNLILSLAKQKNSRKIAKIFSRKCDRPYRSQQRPLTDYKSHVTPVSQQPQSEKVDSFRIESAFYPLSAVFSLLFTPCLKSSVCISPQSTVYSLHFTLTRLHIDFCWTKCLFLRGRGSLAANKKNCLVKAVGMHVCQRMFIKSEQIRASCFETV